MKLIIDLDGTICEEKNFFEKSSAKVNINAKKIIDKLKLEGNTIIIYSARPWNQYEMTKKWLFKNKIKFDQLLLGKPIGDYWIDDRAIKYTDWKKIYAKLKKNKKTFLLLYSYNK